MTSLLDQANNKDNRERFLNRIAKAAGRPRHALKDHPFKPLNTLPDDLLADKSPEELLNIAIKNSESVNAQVVLKPAAQLADFLNTYAKQENIGHLLLPNNAAEEWEKYDLTEWSKNPGVENVAVWSDKLSRQENEENANQADLAVGMGDYLIAATGTVTVVNRPAQGRGFDYLPTRLLLIVPKSGLVKSTREAVNKYNEQTANGLSTSTFNFISGPSNSGDIEMELVVGVHGPVECTYLVVEDR